MPGKYTYSVRAEKDVKDIYLNTAKKYGIIQADKYDSGLQQSLQLIADNPDMGRQCEYIRKGYHRHEYGRHIIFYRKRKNDIFVIRILYDRMNIIEQF